MKVDNRNRTTYRISPLKLWLVPVILIVIAVFMMALPVFNPDVPESTRYFPVYIGIFFLAFAALMYFILRRTRLVLSADGLELYQFGYKLETGWDNIAYLHDEQGSQGLVLHRPMDCYGAHTLSNFRHTQIKNVNFFTDEQIRFIAEHRLIPLDAFAYWLRKGELRTDLARRAPTLANG